MITKLYRMTDTIKNEIILDNMYSQGIVKHFQGRFTNVARYARSGTLYQNRYLFEAVVKEKVKPNRSSKERGDYKSKDESLMLNTNTEQNIIQKCLKFKIGDQVYINKFVKGEDGKVCIVKQILATVVDRSNYFLEIQTKRGTRLSFTYKDIVLFGVLEHKQGGSVKSN